MNKSVLGFLTILILFAPLSLMKGEEVNKQTYTFAVKDKAILRLDRYSPKELTGFTPCLLFVFGGGFVSGERDADNYLPFFHAMVENGMQVVSIDYRKGMQQVKKNGLAFADPEDIITLLAQSIDMATEDLIDATAYVLEKANEWQVDTSKIISCGSSAGAISVLHGEYAVANQMKVAEKLPRNFRYAGIISMAGAIFSTKGPLDWSRSPSPILFFHGNADKNVPYDTLEVGSVGFYGSRHLAGQLEKMEVPYCFYDEQYGDHKLANKPMYEQIPLMMDFIEKNILGKKGLRMHLEVKVNDRKPVNTSFSIEDYVMSNFGN